ncbi:MAG: hypothetical protein DRI44_09015 [Chlamydiae bacterium]|nr:MAG: hypothetical protein DRI44_09015 [Chlamydiota bacterium]
MNKLIFLFLFCVFSAAAYAGKTASQNFNAAFIDNMNVTTYVNNVQYKSDYIDKSTTKTKFVICGKRGKSTVTIPWSKIKRIDFVDEKKKYNAVISLKDGRRVLIYAEFAHSEYKGENDFGGSFLINAEYVRAIIFN